MQRSTRSGSYPRDLKGTARTPTQASGTGFSDLKATATPTPSCLPRDQTLKAQGSSDQCLHSAPTTYTDVDPKSDQGPARKYSKDEQVYILNDYGIDGLPTKCRLWICCMEYDSKNKVWRYRVKDKNGETIGWYTERELERLSTQT